VNPPKIHFPLAQSKTMMYRTPSHRSWNCCEQRRQLLDDRRMKAISCEQCEAVIYDAEWLLDYSCGLCEADEGGSRSASLASGLLCYSTPRREHCLCVLSGDCAIQAVALVADDDGDAPEIREQPSGLVEQPGVVHSAHNNVAVYSPVRNSFNRFNGCVCPQTPNQRHFCQRQPNPRRTAKHTRFADITH
jgi:hypothetical protein